MSADRWLPADLPDLRGRRALVTGATSGIGAAVARALAEHGAEVVLAARSARRLEATTAALRDDGLGAALRPLVIDLADLTSVRGAAAAVADLGPLHMLVACAGVMATPEGRTVDGLDLQMATNVLGHFALTGLLLGRLVEAGRTEAGPSRVVAVSSVGHRLASRMPSGDLRIPAGRYRPWPAYGRSKLANLLVTVELDRRVRAADLPVTATAAHPGLARTGLVRSVRRGPTAAVLAAAFSLLGQPPEQGAWPVLMAATADLPGATYVGPGGPGEMRGIPTIVGASAAARDPEAARRFWEMAEEATGVRYP